MNNLRNYKVTNNGRSVYTRATRVSASEVR
jgi:hypothetical protein